MRGEGRGGEGRGGEGRGGEGRGGEGRGGEGRGGEGRGGEGRGGGGGGEGEGEEGWEGRRDRGTEGGRKESSRIPSIDTRIQAYTLCTLGSLTVVQPAKTEKEQLQRASILIKKACTTRTLEIGCEPRTVCKSSAYVS